MHSFAVTAGESLTCPRYPVDVVLDTFFGFRASRTSIHPANNNSPA